MKRRDEAIPGRCPWCNDSFWATNPKQRFCSDSHRSYYSKSRSRALEQFWIWWLHDRISPLISERDALSRYSRKTAEYLVERLGFYYDNDLKRFVT